MPAGSSKKVMLGLRLPTDPRWAGVVSRNISDVLTDHAWCEQKAAANAMATIVRYPHLSELVDELTRISIEELAHFQMVLEKIRERGLVLGPEKKDPYIHDLMAFIRKGGSRQQQLVDRLLLAAMIEARSCERFRILSVEIQVEDLRNFYRNLMISEAEHYRTFIGFARKYGEGMDVDARWNDFLEYEAGLMLKYGKDQSIHG